MFPTVSAALLLFVAVATHAANVKNQPAAGYGSSPSMDQAAYPPPPEPNYVQVPYLFEQPAPPLGNSHLCAWDVGFATYGGKHHRSRHPMDHNCDHVFSNNLIFTSKAQKSKNCDKCCKATARLAGADTNSVTGMILIDHRRKRCTCCAPIVAITGYPPQFGFQPFAQPAVGFGAFPTGVNQAPLPQQPAAAPPASGY